MTLALHFEAFKTALAGGIITTAKVFDVVRLTSGTPVRDNYVIVFPSSPRLDDYRYTVQQAVDATARYRWDVRYVGTSVAAVLMWQQQGRENVIGERLTVAGRVCDPMRLVDPVEEGEYRHDPTANLFYLDETYESTSRRA